MYRIDGSVPVTSAIRPERTDFSPLQHSIEINQRRQEEKARQAQAERAGKAKQAADEALYNPGEVNDIDYQNELSKMGQQVLSYSAESYKNGTTGTPEHNYNINKLKQDAGLAKGKFSAATSAASQAYQNIDQLPHYVDKGKLNTQVYDAAHPKDAKGGINYNAIDAKSIASVPSDYYHAINTADMYKDKTKTLGEKVYSTEKMFPTYDANDGTALGQMIRSDSTKAKFFKPVMDDKGNVKKWVPGVTDEAAEFLMNNDKEINGEADYQLQNYITEEAAARVRAGDTRDPRVIHNDVERSIDAKDWKLSHVKLNLERLNEVSREQSFKQGYKERSPNEGKDNEDIQLHEANDETYNMSDNGKTVAAHIPVSYRLSGKGMKDPKPLTVNSSEIADIGNDQRLNLVGDQKVYPSRIMKVPYKEGTAKTGWQPQYSAMSKEKLAKDPDIKYKWVVAGEMDDTYTDNDGKEHKSKKSVIIDYDKVADDMQTLYQVSPDKFKKSNSGFNFKSTKPDPMNLNNK